MEEEPLGRRPLLRVLGQGDLHETGRRTEEVQSLAYALLNRAREEKEEASRQAEPAYSLNQLPPLMILSHSEEAGEAII